MAKQKIPTPDVALEPKKVPKAKALTPVKTVPKLHDIPEDQLWAFSFEHWRQTAHFGLDCEKVDFRWFVAFLEKLRTLSKEKVGDVVKYKRDAFGFHEIDWNAKSIPITKAQIDWLPKDIDLDELEIVQFKLSKGLGRVHGFFDDRAIFCVLVLDPMHNLQPSAYSNYMIRPTAELSNEYDMKAAELQRLYSHVQEKCDKDCQLRKDLPEILRTDPSHKFVCINELFQTEMESLWQSGKYQSVDDILMDAVIALVEKEGLQ